MHSLPDSLQSLLESWFAEVHQALNDQRKRREPPSV